VPLRLEHHPEEIQADVIVVHHDYVHLPAFARAPIDFHDPSRPIEARAPSERLPERSEGAMGIGDLAGRDGGGMVRMHYMRVVPSALLVPQLRS